MSFFVKPTITSCDSIHNFFKDWKINKKDLIITNAYVLEPHLTEKAPCDVLYQELYGGGEPNDEMIDAMLDAIRGKHYERIIAIGGGTVIDIAKLFVFGDGLSCEEIFEKKEALSRKRKLLIIPTTCGTGSEVTGISIVEFKKKKTKIGLSVPALFADEGILIPELLTTMPYEVFAASSIDALIHAVESYVSPKANAFTRAMGKTAIEKMLTGYQKLISGENVGKLPKDMTLFLEASTMAGIAFGNAGCAAVHAMSYPIGAIYHVPHGKANYLVFEAVYEGYQRLGANLDVLEEVLTDVLKCEKEKVWKSLFALLDQVLERKPLETLGVDEKTCAEMAISVTCNQQRLLLNNPIRLSEKDIEDIYLSCL